MGMRHLILGLTLLLSLVSSRVGQEIFLQGSRPYILLRTSFNPFPEPNHPQFNARAGIQESSSSEEEVHGQVLSTEDEDRIIIKNITTKVQPNYSEEVVAKNRRLPPPIELKSKTGTGSAESSAEEPASSAFRFLWPFQVSVTKTKGGHGHLHQHDKIPYPQGVVYHEDYYEGAPPSHGRHHHHHGHHHGHHHHHKGHHGHHGHQHYHHDDGHGLEYEKVRLKYEIYKLKAKSKIAILQNKIELKKILSLILQQKIKALEWIS